MARTPPPALVSFQAATQAFRQGKDTPRDFLERAIARLEASEPTLRAFAALSLPRARIAADAATARWRAGQPLSRIDGMPIGLKDIIETFDMPTGMGSPTSDGYRAPRDAASVFALREAGARCWARPRPPNSPAATRPTLAIRTTRSVRPAARAPARPARSARASCRWRSARRSSAPSCGPPAIAARSATSRRFGAINRGGSHDFQSHSCIGLIGASLADIWCTAHESSSAPAATRACPACWGKAELAAPAKPARLIQLETPGWDDRHAGRAPAPGSAGCQLSAAGVEIVSRHNNTDVAAFERSLASVLELGAGHRRLRIALAAEKRGLPRPPGHEPDYARAAATSPTRWAWTATAKLLGRRVGAARRVRDRWPREVDGFMTLDATGAAPMGMRRTGNPCSPSRRRARGAGAIAAGVRGRRLPLGVQVMGAQHSDEKCSRSPAGCSGDSAFRKTGLDRKDHRPGDQRGVVDHRPLDQADPRGGALQHVDIPPAQEDPGQLPGDRLEHREIRLSLRAARPLAPPGYSRSGGARSGAHRRSAWHWRKRGLSASRRPGNTSGTRAGHDRSSLSK